MNIFIPFTCLLTFAFITACVFTIWQSPEKPTSSLIMKAVASFCFCVLAIVSSFLAPNNDKSMMFIIIGLVASIFGDVFLACVYYPHFNKENVIRCGMVAFAVAQIFYFVGLCFIGGVNLWCLLIASVITLLIVFGEKPLKLKYGKLLPFVAGYSFFLALSLAQSVLNLIALPNIPNIILAVGFTLFFLSDLVLAFIYFPIKKHKGMEYANYALYYLGQILIAAALLFL